MRAWITASLTCLFAGGALAADPPPGRTDGPVGSEIGKGGYHYGRTAGTIFLEPFLGAATVDIEPNDGEDISQTELVYGLSVGYLMEDWLGVQAGYAYIGGDQKTSLFSAGVRNVLNYEPFNYYLRLDAELYSPDVGDTQFGIVPGVGAEVVLTDHVRMGLQYQRDFIFSDDNISIHRFTARLKYRF